MTRIILAYLAVINLAAFFAFGVDKHRAEKNRDRKKNKLRRIPERTLLRLALVGGSVGAYAGMQVFRHKTQHRKFSLSVPLMVMAHLALVFWIFMK